jgi:DNA-binding LacI/PurR family transcriptional regulator/ribosomal protein S25
MSAANKQKFMEIADSLAKVISKMESGDKFFTANDLKEHYNITISTSSRVIKELQSRGLISSKRGIGSVVSSQRRQEFILCVLPDELPVLPAHWLLFQAGICFHCGTNYEHYSIISIPVSKVEQQVDSLQIRSQPIAGAVFFRDCELFLDSAPKLENMGVNTVFYGSSSHKKELTGYNCCFYDEEEIINLAMTHLYKHGHRRIGCIYDSKSSLDFFRHGLYLKFLKKHRLSHCKDMSLDTSGEHYAWFDDVLISSEKRRKCRNYLSSVTALLVLHDNQTVILMQQMSKLGFEVPDDISIVSIDNLQLGEIIRPKPDSVDLDIYKNTLFCLELLEKTKNSEKKEMLLTPLSLKHRQSVINI